MGFKDKSDLWTICNRGHVHWGTHGAAGFLFCHVPPDGQPLYLLQQRSRWVDHGGTWGFPGGAIKDRESPEMTARRETQEEIGSLPPYRVTGVQVQDCGGGWKFHIVTADVDRAFDAYCGQETDATGWFTREEMRYLSLHPGVWKWLCRGEEDK
jgi:8-oxo-dGTP diphosphatase